MQLTLTTYAISPTSLTVADGTSTPPFAVLADSIDWGNATFQHSYSGARGTLGRRPSAGIVDNRLVSLPIRVYGTSKDNLATNLKNLSNVVDELRRFGGRLTWQSNAQTYRQHLEILGTDGAQLQGWSNRAENKSIAQVVVALQCAPYAQGDSMDVTDTTFASLSDYTFDSGASTNLTVTNGNMTVTTSPTTEHRLIHSQRGYTLSDTEVTTNFTYAQSANFKAGVVFWRTSATSYWTAYLTDSGSASTLNIDQVSSGTTTNRASQSVTRPAAAASVYVRVRTESTSITAEHWTSAPTPLGTATTSTTYTASSAGSGLAGIVFNPQSSTPLVDFLTVRPFTYSTRAQPARIDLSGTVPGDAPALGSVEITTKQSLPWALVGWTLTPSASSLSSSPTPRAAFTVFNANSDVTANRTGWTADATTNTLRDTAAASTTTYSARYQLDPSLLTTDQYAQGDRAIEVWALAITDTSDVLVSPMLKASLRPSSGPGPVRYTDEYGSVGKIIPSIQAGNTSAAYYRWTRLGTLHLPASAAREVHLTIDGTVGTATSGGYFGIARLIVLPLRQRATISTGKTADSTYPAWSSSTTETVKTLNADLTTSVYQPSVSTVQVSDRGVGGSTIEMRPGTMSLLTCLSAIVPDDPTSSTATEYVTTGSPGATTVPQAAVHVSIVPRFAQLRS